MTRPSHTDLEEPLRAAVRGLYERFKSWPRVAAIVGRVVVSMSQEGNGDAPAARDERPGDASGPPSVPADLTAEQQERIRALLWELHAKHGTWQLVSTVVGYSALYIETFVKGEVAGSMHFALYVARAVGVELEDMLAGRAP
jgi:hypothetical protein